MKRKILFFALMIAITGMVTMQSCTKEEAVAPKTYLAAMPAEPVPSNEAILPFTGTGQAINLAWAGTATNAVTWSVYFGKSSTPDLVSSTTTTNAYATTITSGGTYYWQVSTTDANNLTTTSPVWQFQVNSNPAAAGAPSPALDEDSVSCNPSLAWEASDPEDDDLTYDLYLGKTTDPAVYQSGLTDPSFDVVTTLTANTDYYWKVVVHDPYGGESTSPIWKFTTGALPISTFVGSYNADEPAEAYSYGVGFTLVNASSIKCDNYWNSGWVVNFTLDLTKLTYTFPVTTFQTGWTGTETGIIDLTTGTMTGTYTIWHNGAIAEQGVHTYTKVI